MCGDRDAMAVQHMLEYSRKALAFVEGRGREDLAHDDMLFLALIRALEVVGEAAARVSDECRAAYCGVPWRDVIGMPNRLIHGYDSVDPALLWDTVTVDVPALIAALTQASET